MSGARRLALVLAVVAGCGGAAAGGGASSAPSSTGAEASSTTPSTTPATLTSDEGPSTDLADYARRTMAIVRRHWSVPAALGAPDTVVLESSIEIVIDPSSRLATGFRVLHESGNADFDASIRRGLVALVDAHETMPEPPLGLDDRSSVRLRLRSH